MDTVVEAATFGLLGGDDDPPARTAPKVPSQREEDAAREKSAEEERNRKRRSRLRRVFTSPEGALVSEGNLGRPRLFGQ